MKSTGYLRQHTGRCLRGIFALVSLGGMLPHSGLAQNRLFSVRDSIEMTTFSDPYTRSPQEECKSSPNGEYFFVITTKGILHANQLRSTIWLYRTARVLGFLRHPNADAPRPRPLIHIQATPKAQQFDSYGSLITKAQWSSDSSGILFLAETGDGLRRLYKVEIGSGRMERLSASSADVEDFVQAAGTTVYVSRFRAHTKQGIDIKSLDGRVSRALTGHSLLNIFDPDEFSPTGTSNSSSDLWAARGNHRTALNRRRGSDGWHYPGSASAFFHVALSPNGKTLIAARPVSEVRPSWREFVSRLPDFDFAKLPTREINPDRDWLWPWQYLYIDIAHRRAYPLTEAPSAWMAGYGDPFQASWSPDGKRVLVTSTYLSSTSDATKSKVPCAVAVFSVVKRETECVAYAKSNSADRHLRSAQFGSSSDEVLIQWSKRGTLTQELYRHRAGNWVLAATTNAMPPAEADLSVSIRQELDEPPALWATDHHTGVSKKLWQLNSQLSSLSMGDASVYRWTDSSGYEWKAGLVKPYGYISGHRYPLVIQTHGFEEHEFLVDGSYTTGFAAQPLAAAGIMVLQMEDRRDRHRRGVSQEARLFAEGCTAAIHQLANDGLIDPTRVGIIGFSRTSWYVETALVNYPQLFKAATVIDGVDQGYVNYILFCAGMPPCRTEPEMANGGPPFGKALAGWLESAPSFRLDRVQAPVRIEAINWYSILQEWEIYSSLFQQGKPVDLNYISDGQHILQEPKQRFASQQGNVDWFRFWLQGFEDPSPLKRSQYRRWAALKVTTSATYPPALETTENAAASRRAR